MIRLNSGCGRNALGAGYSLLVLLAFLMVEVATAQSPGKASAGKSGDQISQSGQAAGLGSSANAEAKTGKTDGEGNLQLGGRRPLYRLNRSDVVTLSFTLSPEFDQTLTIQPDGYIMLKDASPVYALGLTIEELQVAILRAYTGYLHDPQVAVALKDFQHPYFVAGGELGRPGRYELRAPTTIVEAVEIAGGFTHQAKHSQVLLFRRVNDELVEAHVFNLKSMLKKRNLSEVAELRPGDLIFVPQNAVSKIQPFLTRPALDMYVSPTQF